MSTNLSIYKAGGSQDSMPNAFAGSYKCTRLAANPAMKLYRLQIII